MDCVLLHIKLGSVHIRAVLLLCFFQSLPCSFIPFLFFLLFSFFFFLFVRSFTVFKVALHFYIDVGFNVINSFCYIFFPVWRSFSDGWRVYRSRGRVEGWDNALCVIFGMLYQTFSALLSVLAFLFDSFVFVFFRFNLGCASCLSFSLLLEWFLIFVPCVSFDSIFRVLSLFFILFLFFSGYCSFVCFIPFFFLSLSEASIFAGGLLLDLYCGAGTVGLILADRFDKVIGVEIVEDVRSAESSLSFFCWMVLSCFFFFFLVNESVRFGKSCYFPLFFSCCLSVTSSLFPCACLSLCLCRSLSVQHSLSVTLFLFSL